MGPVPLQFKSGSVDEPDCFFLYDFIVMITIGLRELPHQIQTKSEKVNRVDYSDAYLLGSISVQGAQK